MTTSPASAVRAILARVQSIGALLKDEPFLSKPEWLLLPLAKQDVALQRLTALRAYDKIDSPTSGDALRAAKAAGVAIARFYQLVAHWRANDRSPFSLVPHQKLGMERPTRLAAEETASAISGLIRNLLKSDPLAPSGKVISHVRQEWKGPGALPSDTALRVFHERAIRSLDPAPGTLTLNVGRQSQEGDVVAERFLEAIVIDHVSIKGVVTKENGLRPTITLAFDLWSGSPLGATAVAGSPGAPGVVLALQDMAERLGRSSNGDGAREKPPQPPAKIVISTTFAKQWRELVDLLMAQGHQVIERRDVSLHQGGPTRRLLGMGLGRLRLESRLERGAPFECDPKVTAVIPIKTIGRLLSEEVDEMARRRVPQTAWGTAITFDPKPLVAAIADGTFEPLGRSPRSNRGRGLPTDLVGADMQKLLVGLAETRTPGGAADVKVRRADDHVWHLTVAPIDPLVSESAFTELAKGAMEISATYGVPVVVHIEDPPNS